MANRSRDMGCSSIGRSVQSPDYGPHRGTHTSVGSLSYCLVTRNRRIRRAKTLSSEASAIENRGCAVEHLTWVDSDGPLMIPRAAGIGASRHYRMPGEGWPTIPKPDGAEV